MFTLEQAGIQMLCFLLSTTVFFRHNALLQSEREPGLPSQNWRSFERIHDLPQQEDLEGRTGLKWRLEAVARCVISCRTIDVF